MASSKTKRKIFVMLVTYLLLVLFSFANEPVEDINWEEKFRPHMVDHINLGCPTNSYCSQKLGLMYDNWVKATKKKNSIRSLNRAIKSNGFPLEAWGQGKSDEHISWHSMCEHHRKSDTRSIIFFDKGLEKERKGIIKNKIVLKDGKQIKTFVVPRGQRPLYISKSKLVFTYEVEGRYFNIHFPQQGKPRAFKYKGPKFFSKKAPCTSELKEEFFKLFPKNHFNYFSCESIWNEGKKTYQNYIIGKSCAS